MKSLILTDIRTKKEEKFKFAVPFFETIYLFVGDTAYPLVKQILPLTNFSSL